MHANAFVLLLILLEFEFDAYKVGKWQTGIIVLEECFLPEEAEISDSKDVGTFTLFVGAGLAVLAGPHREENCNLDELGYGDGLGVR